jgi:hypothetical protein
MNATMVNQATYMGLRGNQFVVSEPWVMEQNYTVENTGSSSLANMSFYMYYFPSPYGSYPVNAPTDVSHVDYVAGIPDPMGFTFDITMYGEGTAANWAYTGLSTSVTPTAHDIGHGGGYPDPPYFTPTTLYPSADPTDVLRDVENNKMQNWASYDAPNGTDPNAVAGAFEWYIGTLAPGTSWTVTVLQSVAPQNATVQSTRTLQYYLNVVSPYDTPTGQGWYYNGTTAFASLANGLVDYGNGTREVFTQWSGDATGTDYSNSNPIYMDQNKTAIANWETQEYLTVQTAPLGIVTIPGQGWYNQGQGAPLTAPSVSGYAFTYWDVDGVSQGNGINSITVTMDGPHTATAHYGQAYVLTIQTTLGGSTSPAPGGYNYVTGSSVQVTAVPSTNYVLDYWSLDGVNVGFANPYTVLMDNNHTLEAVFESSPPIVVSISPMSTTVPLDQAVVFMSIVSGGIPPYSYQWYLDGSAVPGATSSSWTFATATIGLHYVQLTVTDSKGNTGESGTARVEVTPVPVGGYSVSLKGQATANPLTTYLSLLGASTIILTAVKRKRRS